MAAGQAELGHDVRLATYDEPDRRHLIDRALDRVPHFDKVQFRPLRAPRSLRFMLPRDTRAALRQLVREVDVVHLHNLWQPLMLATMRECRRHDRPYVVILHGHLHPWSLNQSRLKKRVALFLAFRRLLENAAALQLGTAAEQELVERLDLHVERRIIPNGIFLEEIDPLPAPGTFRRGLAKLSGRRFVLFLGRLHYKKGLDILASAFARIAARHSDVDLVVVGPDDGARGSFEDQVARLALTHRVHLPGPLFGDDKLAAMVDADCFCLPSRQEGFSVAVLEALACRTPVVISEDCDFPEVMEAGAGVVTDLDVARVATALDGLLSDPNLRHRQGVAARELVERRYTWPKVAEQTVSLYQDVLDIPRGTERPGSGSPLPVQKS
jgi:glycosyltransferase involved in cell wall biosynthesis